MNSAGIVLTWLFTPEPLRVPLSELDRRYAYHTAGKTYHGAVLETRQATIQDVSDRTDRGEISAVQHWVSCY